MPTLVAQYTWDANTESPNGSSNMTRSTTTVHDGAGSVRLLAPNDVAYWLKNAVGVTQVIVLHGWMRFHVLPDITTANILGTFATGPGFLGLGYNQATGKMYCEIGNQSPAASGGATLVIDTWYEVDLRIKADVATATVDARINQVALTTNSTPGGPFTLLDYRLGEFGASQTYDLFFDTLDVSHTSADFPLGAPTATVPLPPQVTQATGSNNQVDLAWIPPASDGGSPILSYKIYRGTSSGGETLLASPAGVGLTYTDSTAVNGTNYYYEVTATNAVGESAVSNEYPATPQAPGLSAQTRTLKRLYGPTLLSNAAATLYTVPASTVAVIRHVHVSNPTGSPVNFSLSIGTNAVGTRIWDAQPIPAGDVLDHYQNFTLAAGEIIQGFASTTLVLNLILDGYELGIVGVAPPIYPSDTLFPSETSP